jgi:predicted Fe-Mo cluster-binding NifX family protein
MKVAVSAAEKDLEALLDPLFGRCACFIIVDTVDMSFEAFENPNIAVQEEAGIQSARFVASKGAEVVMTGHCGPNAFQELTDNGIEIITGVMGTVRQVVDRYRTGRLLITHKANVEEYFGKKQSALHENKNQHHDDSGDNSKHVPWYGYVRLQQEKPVKAKGDK